MTDRELTTQGAKIMHNFVGWQMVDVFGVLLCGLIVAARKLGMNKLEVQEIFVEHWDHTAK